MMIYKVWSNDGRPVSADPMTYAQVKTHLKRIYGWDKVYRLEEHQGHQWTLHPTLGDLAKYKDGRRQFDGPVMIDIAAAIQHGLNVGGAKNDWDAPGFKSARDMTRLAGCVWDFVGWLDALRCVEQGMLGGVDLNG